MNDSNFRLITAAYNLDVYQQGSSKASEFMARAASLTAPEVRRRLIDEKKYSDHELSCVRTIQKKLNNLNYRIQKVQKFKPKKLQDYRIRVSKTDGDQIRITNGR